MHTRVTRDFWNGEPFMPTKPSKPRKTSKPKSEKSTATSFYPPMEPDWHRMIAEAAYYRAERRGFSGDQALEDWLSAEADIKKLITPAVS